MVFVQTSWQRYTSKVVLEFSLVVPRFDSEVEEVLLHDEREVPVPPSELSKICIHRLSVVLVVFLGLCILVVTNLLADCFKDPYYLLDGRCLHCNF